MSRLLAARLAAASAVSLLALAPVAALAQQKDAKPQKEEKKAAGDSGNQTTTASTNSDDIKVAKALRSLTEPESPTFTLLGVSPNDVTRPESPKKAVFSILNSLDQDGNLQSGLAMEFSPYLLFGGDRLTLDAYRKDWWRRQLSYFQLGFGTAKGGSDKDKSLKGSIGFLWTPINGMDPYANEQLTQCLAAAVQGSGPLRPPSASELPAENPAPRERPAAPGDSAIASEIASLRSGIDSLQARLDAAGMPAGASASFANDIGTLRQRLAALEARVGSPANAAPAPAVPRPVAAARGGTPAPGRDDAAEKANEEKAYDECFDKHPLFPDNTTSLQLGFAPLFISETGKTGDFKSRGFAATALLRIGLTRLDPQIPAAEQYRSQLLLSASYRKNETIADPNVKDAFLIRDRWNAGGRFVYGKPSSVFYSLEALYQSSHYRTGQTDRYLTFVGGIDFRVSDDLWLGLSAGTSAGRTIGGDTTFIGSRFRWGFGQKSSIGAEFKPVKVDE